MGSHVLAPFCNVWGAIESHDGRSFVDSVLDALLRAHGHGRRLGVPSASRPVRHDQFRGPYEGVRRGEKVGIGLPLGRAPYGVHRRSPLRLARPVGSHSSSNGHRAGDQGSNDFGFHEH